MLWKAPVAPAQTAADPQPNIIFILTDDMRKDDLNPTYMPQTTKQLVEKGMSFQNAFVSNPLCCPSRATIMRGQYGHNTDIWFNTNIFDPDPNVNDGGWLGYNGNHYEEDNVATHLNPPRSRRLQDWALRQVPKWLQWRHRQHPSSGVG
jgi:N-acetylglucosamine-6-sulfatase